jgi:hypothetical protein
MNWERVIDLRFHGDRFEGGSLEVDALPEIVAFKSIVVAVAESLWRKRHPSRDRLKAHFRDSLQLRFTNVGEGSAVAPLERGFSSPQTALEFATDEFDDALGLVTKALDDARNGSRLPDGFPKDTLQLFGGWGKTLRAGEWIGVCKPDSKSGARFDPDQRSRILAFVEPAYEDVADQVGFVLATSVRKERFELYETLDAKNAIEVPLPERDEKVVLDAARDYENVRVRVKGLGAFDAHGTLLRFRSVSSITLFGADESGEVDNEPLWRAMDAISDNVADEEWAKLPPAASIDEHLRRGIRR